MVLLKMVILYHICVIRIQKMVRMMSIKIYIKKT